MINREAFERARHETDFIAELALSLKELADDLEGCADREDLECIMKTRRALGSKREKVWDIAQRSAPPELRDRWREAVELRIREFDDMATQVQNLAAIGNWDSAYGRCLDLSTVVVDRALRDMDEALVQRYLELVGTPSATYKQVKAPSQRARAEAEVRTGDSGVLEWSITAEDTAGLKHRIPAGTEVRVAEIRVAYTSFYTEEAIEGQTYFTSPSHEFKAAFRKRGTSPISGERVEAGIFRCRYCGAPYAYRENLELHERGCPRRGR